MIISAILTFRENLLEQKESSALIRRPKSTLAR